MAVAGLGYIGVHATEPNEWLTFGTDVLGMVPATKAPEGAIALRLDDRRWRVAVHQSSTPGLAYIGWECAGIADWEAAVAAIEAHGVAVKIGSDDEAADRAVQGLASFSAPGGHDTEIFYGQEFDPHFVSPLGVQFLTEGVGMGHAVLTVPPSDYEEAAEFYQRALGFRVTEYLRMGPNSVTFMHCNRRHHSLGLAGVGSAPGFHHFMIEATSIDDVGRCWDRCSDGDVPIMLTIGRHSDDRMFSFYMVSPSGFGIEYGADGRLIDPDSWSVLSMAANLRDGELWGHRVPGEGQNVRSAPEPVADVDLSERRT